MSATVISLDAVRRARGVEPPREEALLPPPGKRRGDPVTDSSGARGIVVGAAYRALCSGGPTLMLAVQFPGVIRVLTADEVSAEAQIQPPCDVGG